MPSFFDKLFNNSSKKNGDVTKVAQPPAVPALPATMFGQAAGPVLAEGGQGRSASAHSHVSPQLNSTVNSSFAREDSSSSHIANMPMVPPGTKIMVPAPRGGMKIIMPPPKMGGSGTPPVFFPPAGAGHPQHHNLHQQMLLHQHQHHHHQHHVAPSFPAPAQAPPQPQVPPEPTVQATPPQSTDDQHELVSTAAPSVVVHAEESPQAHVDVSATDSDEIMFNEESEGETEAPKPPLTSQEVPAAVVQQAAPLSAQQALAPFQQVPLKQDGDGSPKRPTSANSGSISFTAHDTPLSPLATKSALDPLSPRAPETTARKTPIVEVVPLPKPEHRQSDDFGRDENSSEKKATVTTTVSTVAPSAIGKQKIADMFLSILCPQQYFGKVLRVRDVRSVADVEERRRALTAVSRSRKILAATKHGEHSLFYPLVRFDSSDVGTTNDAEQRTTIALFDIVPSNMGFADDPTAAEALLQDAASSYDSCYVLSKSAIMLADKHKQSCPLATLSVCWAPFYLDKANGTCSLHNVPFELFDTNSKELLCALCLAKSPDHRAVTVLSELMSEPSTRRVFHSLNAKVNDSSRIVHRLMVQHRRASEAAERQCAAIDQQFDMLIAAIESKRRELREASRDEFSAFGSSIAKEILAVDEQVQIMKAASEHISKSAALKPLQLGTIAHALAVAERHDATYASQTAPPGATVNLEGAMTAVQRLALYSKTDVSFNATTPNKGGNVRSPIRASSPSKVRKQKGASPARTPRRISVSRKPSDTDESDSNAASNGESTNVFNCSIHDLLCASDSVSWTIRIQDPADWVGVGVGVGGTNTSWSTVVKASSKLSADLSHLWIVPSRAPRTLVLRVVALNGIAKLSIYDKRGKQLDDGRIAHWHASRSCFPQVTFGGKGGQATIVKGPEAL